MHSCDRVIWNLSKLVFSSFHFPLYMNFLGETVEVKKTFSMSEFDDFKKTYICIYVKKNLHKIAIVSLTGKGGGAMP